MAMTATHTHEKDPAARQEACRICGGEAWHKVEEDTLFPRHPFTAYVCCGCFGLIMGPLAEQWCRGEWP
jgi:hypothetical protein